MDKLDPWSQIYKNNSKFYNKAKSKTNDNQS